MLKYPVFYWEMAAMYKWSDAGWQLGMGKLQGASFFW